MAAGESYISTTQVDGGAWTEEQYFTHDTQDTNHGARQGTSHVYTRKGRGRRRRQWMNLSICDRAYRVSTQNKAHRIHSYRIIKNLTANNSTVIVGHSSPINNMIQSNSDPPVDRYTVPSKSTVGDMGVPTLLQSAQVNLVDPKVRHIGPYRHIEIFSVWYVTRYRM
ncbi:hypothetical protein B296_00047808, partial [Ensete ventricosum]